MGGLGEDDNDYNSKSSESSLNNSSGIRTATTPSPLVFVFGQNSYGELGLGRYFQFICDVIDR